MFDIGWSELLIIGVVALIVIGPKDLPEMFRQLGRFTAKLRSMARDFQRTMEAAADEAGVKDVAKDLKAVANPKSLGIDAVREAANKFEKWDPLKPAAAAKPVVAAGPKAAAAATAPAAATTAAPPADTAAAPTAPAEGPATQALREKQAERNRIAMEAAEKMRAVGKATAAPAPAPAPAPVKAAVTRKPRAAKIEAAPAAPEAPAAAPAKRARKPKDAP